VIVRTTPPSRVRAGARARRLSLAGLLILAALVLASCGGSSKGLIPLADAGPLKGDFEEVFQAAKSANGDCAATNAAIDKTKRDFAALPGTVDASLRKTLSEGIEDLREHALALCEQPATQTTTGAAPPPTHQAPPATTPAKTPPATTTPVTTQPSTNPHTTPATTPSTAAPPNNGGGTAAPNTGAGGAAPGSGHEPASGHEPGSGHEPASGHEHETSENESAGERAGGQEAGK
jgi:hypothetical protein